jgi:cytochrome P450
MALALAIHPIVRRRAVEEQERFGGASPVTPEQIREMTYLDQVLLEVERLYPPASFGFRGVQSSFFFGGFEIPAGWQVMYSMDATHRDPRYFERPDEFIPERFEKGNPRGEYRLLGFGGGPRVCLGMALARMNVKLTLAKLLRSYEWTLEPNQDLSPRYMPARRPRDGLLVEFRRR